MQREKYACLNGFYISVPLLRRQPLISNVSEDLTNSEKRVGYEIFNTFGKVKNFVESVTFTVANWQKAHDLLFTKL